MSDEKKSRLAYAARGILVGGGVGVIFSWFTSLPMERGLFLGMLCGCLAGLTLHMRREER